jgi:hypothetical protein
VSDQPLTNPPVPVAPTATLPMAVPGTQAPVSATQAATAEVIAGAERCLNCDAILTGEFCAHCGQNAKHHVHSTIAMVGELIEDLFHTDHRVWRTIVPLLTKPGFLTREYLQGKRVSYTPPFRLYIVLSLIYFFIASLSHDETNIVVSTPDKGEPSVQYQLDEGAQGVLEEFLTRVDPSNRPAVRDRVEKALRQMPPKEQRATVANMSNPCAPDMLGKALPDTMAGRDRILDACRKVTKNQGKDFMEELKHHIPQMMFFFLPLIALWAKVLYPFSKRYYAEHFLFFVHFHAAFFLVMAIYNLLGLGLGLLAVSWAGTASGLLTTFVVFYTPLYLYFAMRRVYGQGRFVTSLKYMMLLGGYVANGFIAFAVFAAYTAMMIK